MIFYPKLLNYLNHFEMIDLKKDKIQKTFTKDLHNIELVWDFEGLQFA